jgi:hypothetical protein
MAQHQRGIEDEPSDAPVLVVVGVGTADPHGRDADDHLPRPRLRNGPLLDDDLPRPAQHSDPHGDSGRTLSDEPPVLT